MAVFRNYYNKRILLSWTVSVSCLYLLCSTSIIAISCSLTSGEKVRHHRVKSQIEKNLVVAEEEAKTVTLGCPNCLHNNDDDDKKRTELRLNVIKMQILQKLGLNGKPNVTYSLPKAVVMATLERAQRELVARTSEDVDTTSERTGNSMEIVDADDFYGKTSEIISFAEKGPLVNENRLLEFMISSDSGTQTGQQFRVRQASLWLRADLGKPSATCRTTDIFVFKFISKRVQKKIDLTPKQFLRYTGEPIRATLNASHTGWQKIDLTSMVKKWLHDPNRGKLSLFVDCSCCANWQFHLFNEDGEKSLNSNRPFLVIYTDPHAAKRVRRRAIDCTKDAGDQCCKENFFVNFTDLGWQDWVIAPPQGYYANYCRGVCDQHSTPDSFLNYNRHVMDSAAKVRPIPGMTPCCAPVKFSSMSLIYYGPENTIIKRDLPKMVVEECGCP